MKKFADEVRNRRKIAGKSRDELADSIGVSTQTIWKWETNKTSPNVDEIVKLAKVLRCSVAALFHENILPKDLLEKPEIVLEAIRHHRQKGSLDLE